MYLPCKNCGRHFETWNTAAKDSRFCTLFSSSLEQALMANGKPHDHPLTGLLLSACRSL